MGTVVLAVVTAVSWTAPALAATDWDNDGAIETDCRPLDPAVHPGATDHPDLAFEDMNCDGIDGNKTGAYFVQPSGDDNNVGTFNAPFATIQKAINVAKGSPTKSIYVATGTYPERLSLPTDADGVRIYGGYEAGLWTRTTSTSTVVNGQPETALLDGATDVLFQLVTLNGTRGAGLSAYGIRAINGSELALIRATATAGAGGTGANGSTGGQPAPRPPAATPATLAPPTATSPGPAAS